MKRTFLKKKASSKRIEEIITKGDIILLIGKGHENYQDIKGVKYPWDERKAVKEAEEEIKNLKN